MGAVRVALATVQQADFADFRDAGRADSSAAAQECLLRLLEPDVFLAPMRSEAPKTAWLVERSPGSQGEANQFRQRAGLHFDHEAGAIYFNRAEADSETKSHAFI